MRNESSQNNGEVKSRATVHFRSLFHPLSILKFGHQNGQVFRGCTNLIDESLLFELIVGILNGKPIFDPLALKPLVIAPVFV